MKKIKIITIAPCGMNCSLCIGYQREKNKCPGCRSYLTKNNSCGRCSMAKCPELKKNNSKYCFSCEKYPCRRLQQLDKRYKGKYGMSMVENLLFIKEKGIRAFVKREEKKWKCKKCGNITSCHRDDCLCCGAETGKG